MMDSFSMLTDVWCTQNHLRPSVLFSNTVGRQLTRKRGSQAKSFKCEIGIHDPIFPKLPGIMVYMFLHISINFRQNCSTGD